LNDLIHYQNVDSLGRAYRTHELSPIEVINHFLKRINEIDSQLKSYAAIMSDSAKKSAEKLTKELESGVDRGPLHGIPIAVKDLCYTKGVETMGGTAVLQDFVPSFDSTVVNKLRDSGAIILGKLNLTEGAMGGYNPKRQVPRNPWNHNKWAGSSSSGSGAATAMGLCAGSLGSDTGGSIRFPSAACGIVGLKPTYGRVSRYGVLDLAESLDHVGPMTRSVIDAALVLQAIAGHDESDPTTLRSDPLDLLEIRDTDLSGVSLGYDRDYASNEVDEELAALVRDSLDVFESLGANIKPVSMPNIDEFLPAWKTICSAEAYNAHKEFFPDRREEYGPWFREWLETGYSVTANDYIEASKVRSACNGLVRKAMGEVDALICPTTMSFPHYVDDSINYGPMDDRRGTSFQRFTAPYDYNGYPTVSVPCGFSSEGMPGSLQVVGKPLEESTICKIANAYEDATEWSSHHPPE